MTPSNKSDMEVTLCAVFPHCVSDWNVIVVPETVIVSPTEYFDYQIDLLRALEMSRLHFQREMGSLQPGTGDR